MDKRLVKLSVGIDDLIEFAFDPEIFGRIPLQEAGQGLKKAGSAVVGTAQAGAGKVKGAYQSLLDKIAQSRASSAAQKAATGPFAGISGPPTSQGPFATMGDTAPLTATTAATAAAPSSVPRNSINPAAIAPPAGGQAGMATGAPVSQAGQAQQAAQNAGAAAAGQPSAAASQPWWKSKYAMGAGALAGAGGAGYLYGSQRQQQMSAWLDDIIQFQRGSYIAKGKLMTHPELSDRARTIFEKAAGRPAGNSGIRKFLRGQLAYSQKKNPLNAWKFRETPRIFESAEEPIWFDGRPRDPEGRFTPQEGGPDANAMATTYKMPQSQQGSGPSLGQGAGLALLGGAGGAAGGHAYKSLVAKLKKLRK